MRTKVINNTYWYAVDIDCRRNHFFSELHTWLHANIPGGWTTTSTFVGFKEEKDAMFFILAWKDK